MNKVDIIKKIVDGDAFVSFLNQGYINIHINIPSRSWNANDSINDIENEFNYNLELIKTLKHISMELYKTFRAKNDTFNINVKNNTLFISFLLDDIHFV
jgi:hypothetical protein